MGSDGSGSGSENVDPPLTPTHSKGTGFTLRLPYGFLTFQFKISPIKGGHRKGRRVK